MFDLVSVSGFETQTVGVKSYLSSSDVTSAIMVKIIELNTASPPPMKLKKEHNQVVLTGKMFDHQPKVR